MAENTTTSADTLVLDKKLNNYGTNHDFVAPCELTVTITLGEYRRLVESDAKSKAVIETEQSQKWKLQARVQELEKQIEAFKLICPAAAQATQPSEESSND